MEKKEGQGPLAASRGGDDDDNDDNGVTHAASGPPVQLGLPAIISSSFIPLQLPS